MRAGERAGACAQKCAGERVLLAYVCVRVGSYICKCMCKHVQTRVGVCEGLHAGARVCASMHWRVRGYACGGAYMRAHLRMRGRMSACAGERASDNFIHIINFVYVF